MSAETGALHAVSSIVLVGLTALTYTLASSRLARRLQEALATRRSPR